MARNTVRSDEIDQKILRELRANGNIALSKLGKIVGLSNTACRLRVKRLEDSGIISGYTIKIGSPTSEAEVVAFFLVKTEPKGHKHYEEFINFLDGIDDLTEFSLVTGEFDFVIKAICPDYKSFAKLHNKVQGHRLCGPTLTLLKVDFIPS